MTTKDKTKPSAMNGTPRKLKALPTKTGSRKPKDLPSDVGAHEVIIRIVLDRIVVSPFNKRGSLNQQAIAELADSITKIDVIQPVVVRRIGEDLYELVFGERRYRGSILAGKLDIPAVIREYTDEEVIEVQNAENFHREALHFMDEAGAIQEWLRFRSREDIAARIGRPLRYVKDRITLSGLIPDIAALARADRFEFSQCIEIATLAADSQQDFYEKYCKDQIGEDDFYIEDLDEVLESYRQRLGYAPFDIHDALLVPSRGACTACPMNTACASLFPADEKDATCTDRSCYKTKVEAHGWNSFRTIVTESKVSNYLQFGGELTARDKEALLHVPDGIVLEVVRYPDITVVEAPEMPEKMDYAIEGGDEENDEDQTEGGDNLDEDDSESLEAELLDTDNTESVAEKTNNNLESDDPQDLAFGDKPLENFLIDEVEFGYAMEDYQEELDAYHELVGAHEVHTAIGIDRSGKAKIYSFINVPPSDEAPSPITTPSVKYTSKEVMAAVKAGTVTIPMLGGEIHRINDWLKSKEHNDRAETQKTIHKKFEEFVTAKTFSTTFTLVDEALVYWYILLSLDYSDREEALAFLFPGRKFEYRDLPQVEEMQTLTPLQKGYLGCKAIIAKSGSDTAGSEYAEALKSVAQQYIDIAAIQAEEDRTVEARRLKKMPILGSLHAKMSDLDPSRPKQVPEWVVSLSVDDCASVNEFVAKYKIPEAVTPNEGMEERAEYAGQEQIKKAGYLIISAKDSQTGKMVTFIPKDQSIEIIPAEPIA
jgi:ParB/RepB/Spo0J family partition protein